MCDADANAYRDAFGEDGQWETLQQFDDTMRRMKMTPLQMAAEFRTIMGQPRNVQLTVDEMCSDVPADTMAMDLIEEEFAEVQEAWENESDEGSDPLLKELADLVYVVYGYADYRGWNLDKALARIHLSNMSKLDPTTGQPIRREDGKVLKGPNYKPPYLKDLV